MASCGSCTCTGPFTTMDRVHSVIKHPCTYVKKPARASHGVSGEFSPSTSVLHTQGGIEQSL